MDTTNISLNDSFSQKSSLIIHYKWLLYIGILLIFIIIRAYAWSNVKVLEDHDSAHYLSLIRTFQNFDLKEIWNLSPDDTFFYPVFETIFSLPGWSLEFSARLCSFIFTIGTFFLIIAIGEKIASIKAVLVALILFTFNPFFIPFSFGVLTEPSYLATLYLGIYIYLKKYKNPSIINAIVLGIIFALTFLNRTEGILFLVIIPVFQFVHYLFFKKKEYNLKKYLSWVLVYSATFILLISPQIYRVSDMLGTFALNGRQVWMAMLKNPDGKSYEEKKHGLDYSPKEVNIAYLESHPEAYKKLESSESISSIVSLFMAEVSKLSEYQLSTLLGAVILIFFGIGLYSLLYEQKTFELVIILLFIIIELVPPALHNVALRHISMVGPIMILIAGLGIVFIFNETIKQISNEKIFKLLKRLLLFFILTFIISVSITQIRSVIKNPTSNSDYSPEDYLKPIQIIKQDIKFHNIKDPIVVLRKFYFTYMAGLQELRIPFTNYKGLVNYCRLNSVDYLFLNYHDVESYPFLKEFKENNRPDFKLLYRSPSKVPEIELFKIITN